MDTDTDMAEGFGNSCPICDRVFTSSEIEKHVNKCLFLNGKLGDNSSVAFNDVRPSPSYSDSPKRRKLSSSKEVVSAVHTPNNHVPDQELYQSENKIIEQSLFKSNIPLSESMRPSSFNEYVGQEHVIGETKLLRNLLNWNDIPCMILWGPPGCGKTSLANVISSICKAETTLRFVKVSAAMAGVNEIKEIVKAARSDLKYGRKTVLFIDEIHRFNKLQQDIFLPHVENGVIVLIGATTENPSFSLNSALLSRCRVIVLEKLSSENIMLILERAVENKFGGLLSSVLENTLETDISDTLIVEKTALQWLSDLCDGDARLALNSLETAVKGCLNSSKKTKLLTLHDIKDIKRSHLLYDRQGDEHYNAISAVHKSIRASDENAALYWLTRMMQSGEDPLYIARRLIRAASEDIGLADPNALPLAVSCMQGCQMLGMPECDVLLAHCTTYLARAPKSQQVYRALSKCKQTIEGHKGVQPPVPLHLRNAPTELMKKLGYGKGYGDPHSAATCMPAELEDINFFK